MRLTLGLLVVAALAVAVWLFARGAPRESRVVPSTQTAILSTATPATAIPAKPSIGFDPTEPQAQRARLGSDPIATGESLLTTVETPGGLTATTRWANVGKTGLLVQFPASWAGSTLSPAPLLGLDQVTTLDARAVLRIRPVGTGSPPLSVRIDATLPSAVKQHVIIQVTP